MQKRCVVNGVFDLLHVGHTRLLEAAKARFDWVLAAVDTDEFVTEQKRPPIIPFNQRIELLRQLRTIDEIVGVDANYGPFCSDASRVDSFFSEWQLQALVCGADDSSYVERWFSHLAQTDRVVVVPRTPDIDTTLILQRCRNGG